MLRAQYCPYRLIFREAAITSRATMLYKDTYFVRLFDSSVPDVYGIGECALFKGLSADDMPDYEDILSDICRQINACNHLIIPNLSSMRFGFETAMLDLQNGGQRLQYFTPWYLGNGAIPINGLVWMGNIKQMAERIAQKIEQGFRCIKFKIGGQDFDAELGLLKRLRQEFTPKELEIRLDANGAFSPLNALERLDRLSEIIVHSIEQPIKPNQPLEMAEICAHSSIPIALDEELIGVVELKDKIKLLEYEHPQYIILKPSLCGGIKGAEEWIKIAQRLGIGWWITSALESNIGLNMLAQWVSTLDTSMPQGLGTGALYENNIHSPLRQIGDGISYDPQGEWRIPKLTWIEPK